MQRKTEFHNKQSHWIPGVGVGGENAVLKAGKYHKYIKNFKLFMHSHIYMSHKHSFT